MQEAIDTPVPDAPPRWKTILFGRRRVPIGRRLLRILGLLSCVLGGLLVWGWLALCQPTFRSSPASETRIDEAALERDVRMLSEDFVPRSLFHFGNTKRTADYIRNRLDEAIGEPGRTRDLWFEALGKRYRNVSLVLAPDAEQVEGVKADRIVLGAHYDAFYEFPGADDNATGVAGLIELARLLAPIESHLGRPVELVSYPLEEPPTYGTENMGSAFHARELKEQQVGVHLMISLEMIGYFTDEPGSQDYPAPFLKVYYPTRGNFIAVAGNTAQAKAIKAVKVSMRGSAPLPVHSLCASEKFPGVDFSDHRNYWAEGFPAVMVTDTAFYRNKAYHTAEDTADRLDYERMGMVVQGVYEAVLDLAAK